MHTTISGVTYRRYRARGMGYTHDKFSEWCSTQKLIKIEENWPWVSWGFADTKSDETIRLLWGSYITEEEPHTATGPDADEREAQLTPAERAINEEIFSILMGEINKEIAREIQAKIACSKSSN